MIKFLEFPMFQSTGHFIQLKDILDAIPDNGWHWHVLDFCGVGVPPQGMTMPEFESATQGSPEGFIFSWPDLKSFSWLGPDSRLLDSCHGGGERL